MKVQLFMSSLLFLVFTGYAQYEPHNGVPPSKSKTYALKNATVVISPEKSIKNATIIIKDDRIENVGTNISIPKDAVVIDYREKVIVPAFIELNTAVCLSPVKKESNGPSFRPQLESNKKGAYHWNESIHPEVDASLDFTPDEKAYKALIEMGFGYALPHHQDGIARGWAPLIALGKENTRKLLLTPNAGSFLSLQKGSSRQTYPSSQMGSIALLRQTFYDVNWYKVNKPNETNLSLEALVNQLDKPFFFVTGDKWEILRAKKIADEFGLKFTYLGSGGEYAILNELKEFKPTVVVPLNFPKAFDVKDPYITKEIPLSELKHWELAPSNPYLLSSSGIPICLTSAEINNAKDFWTAIHKAMERGLSREAVLKALTVQPASEINMGDNIGTLEKGKLASFSIYSNDPFESEAKLLESWILGEQYVLDVKNEVDIAGKYNLLLDNIKYPIELKEKSGKLSGTVTVISVKVDPETHLTKRDTLRPQINVEQTGNNVTLQFNLNDDYHKGSVNLHGRYAEKFGVFEGEGVLPNGKWIQWTAIKNDKVASEKKDQTTKVDSTAYQQKIWFPNMAYGFDSVPAQKTYVIKNTTVWTNEKDGVVKNATVIIKKGKIDYVGTGSYVTPGGAVEIDGTNFHLTSGIIDEHSHIAIHKGVNEGGQANSAEVSIGDVVYPEDINIYRQLSGGVTTSQLLHGSANPIGGQSALIKLKWGHSPQEMLIPSAPKFIKFALGENVKQANWGDFNTVRFPQTRMGVEQVYYDGFKRARIYQKEKASTPKNKFHIDLELEVLSEILNQERHITCHSYVQSEINMLMHVADSLGIKINTFTHILEGYKVADKMNAHGAGGSTFADWWAYKYEVRDAIPYNAKMMADKGVVVAINSDDAEMGRRLNQEAAKAVKYGGMSEQEAWKMVTLNPAKLLHLDDRLGSVKTGKDADLVLWSANPLSIEAKVLMTFIDGILYYDSERDYELRTRNQAEKARIVSKMLETSEKGESTQPFVKKKKGHFHCDTLGEEGSTEENHH